MDSHGRSGPGPDLCGPHWVVDAFNDPSARWLQSHVGSSQPPPCKVPAWEPDPEGGSAGTLPWGLLSRKSQETRDALESPLSPICSSA